MASTPFHIFPTHQILMGYMTSRVRFGGMDIQYLLRVLLSLPTLPPRILMPTGISEAFHLNKAVPGVSLAQRTRMAFSCLLTLCLFNENGEQTWAVSHFPAYHLSQTWTQSLGYRGSRGHPGAKISRQDLSKYESSQQTVSNSCEVCMYIPGKHEAGRLV